MTKEEAITELNTFKIGAKSEIGENALDMAIRSLEAWDTVLYQLDKMITFEKFEGNRQKKNGYRDARNLIYDILKEVEE